MWGLDVFKAMTVNGMLSFDVGKTLWESQEMQSHSLIRLRSTTKLLLFLVFFCMRSHMRGFIEGFRGPESVALGGLGATGSL